MQCTHPASRDQETFYFFRAHCYRLAVAGEWVRKKISNPLFYLVTLSELRFESKPPT